MATRQPSPTSPTRHSSPTTAPSTNTSLKWASLFICRSGRTSTPGASIAITNIVSPLCLGCAGSVRARQMPHSAHIARLVHVFCPPRRHTSPSRSALSATFARSEPASGSENIWHQISAPEAIGRSQPSCCSAVPCASKAGPTMPSPMANGYRSGTTYSRSTEPTRAFSAGDASRPPWSAGQVGTCQPPSTVAARYARPLSRSSLPAPIDVSRVCSVRRSSSPSSTARMSSGVSVAAVDVGSAISCG